MPLLALDLLSRIVACRINLRPPFFRALHALTIDDRGCWTCFASCFLAAFHVKLVMDALKRALVAPQIEVMPHRASRRKILRQRPPLATGGEHVHDGVHDLALVNCTFASAPLGGRNLRLDQLPFLIGHIAWVTQITAVIELAVFRRPHRRPLRIMAALLESQQIPMTQEVFRRTLRASLGSPAIRSTSNDSIRLVGSLSE